MFNKERREERRERRALKKEGYSGSTARRMVGEDTYEEVMEYKMGGNLPKYKKGGKLPTSKKKTSKRIKTTNGGYGFGM